MPLPAPSRYAADPIPLVQGTFDKGQFHGDGLYVFANGSSFEGTFKNGKAVGQGIFQDVDGHVWTGTLASDAGVFAPKPGAAVPLSQPSG